MRRSTRIQVSPEVIGKLQHILRLQASLIFECSETLDLISISAATHSPKKPRNKRRRPDGRRGVRRAK